MNIILIATECFPFAKATSLGDLVSLLAKGIEKDNHNVRIFMPRYGCIDPAGFQIERVPLELKVNLNGASISSSVFKGIMPNSLTSIFFIESQNHFSNSKEIYLSTVHQNETQNRNSFFCLATLETISRLKLNADIIHVFNPVCAQITKLLRSKDFEYSHLKKSKLIFTIQSLEELSGNNDNILLTKEAINYSDFITTVSKTFENELLSDTYNTGIADALIKKGEVFRGFLSSPDDEIYNPETDNELIQAYSKNYFSVGKRKCKEDLYNLLGLEKDLQIPLFGMITGLTENKELDILINIFPEIADLNLQFILWKKGEEETEEKLIRISRPYKNIKVCIGYDHNFAKKIHAALDFYIRPEEIQPCGNSILTAMKYGSIPVAFNSGAIKEIITDVDSSSNEPNGIVFNNHTKEDLLESIIRAIKYYKNKEKWTKLVKSAMSFDTSKLNTAKNYINCYEVAINAKKSQELPLSISSLGK